MTSLIILKKKFVRIFDFFLEEKVGFFQKCGNPPLGGQQEALKVQRSTTIMKK